MAESPGHILFLTYHLPMGAEPGAFRPWMEARLMARAGWTVTVITSGVQYMTGEDIRSGKGWCTDQFVDGIRILRTWALRNHRTSLWKRIGNYVSYTLLAAAAALIRVGQVDRVFAGTDPIVMMPMVYVAAKVKGARLVLDERDLFPETAIAAGLMKDGLISKALFHMQQHFRRTACAIVAATPGIRLRLLEYGHPAEKLFLLYNADAFVDEDLREASPSVDLRELTGRNFVVGYAGGLGIVNDVETLITAARSLTDIPDLTIVIIGNGEMRSAYERRAREQGTPFVHFLSAQPRSVARYLISTFDVCVQPLPPHPHFRHTLTSKTFDYHAVGRPMVFSGEGDTVALLMQSQGGISVRPGDPVALAAGIRALHDDPERRRAMGRAARAWFDANISADASCAVMSSALACKGSQLST